MISINRIAAIGVVILLLGFSVAPHTAFSQDVAAQPDAVDDPLAPMLADFKKPYGYMIAGNEKDLPVNRKKAEFYKSRGETLSSESGNSKKAADYLKLSSLYSELADCNEKIVTSFNEGKLEPATVAGDDLVKIERRISSIMGKPVERDWLTINEMKAYWDAGYEFKTAEPGTLPFAKTDWNLEAKRDMAIEPKAPRDHTKTPSRKKKKRTYDDGKSRVRK